MWQVLGALENTAEGGQDKQAAAARAHLAARRALSHRNVHAAHAAATRLESLARPTPDVDHDLRWDALLLPAFLVFQ